MQYFTEFGAEFDFCPFKKFCNEILSQYCRNLFFKALKKEVSAAFHALVTSHHPTSINTMEADTSSILITSVIVALVLIQPTVRTLLANCVVPTVFVPSIHRGRVNKYHACRQFRVERKSRQRFSGCLTDQQLRRYFLMSKICFSVDEFKSETYWNCLLSTQQQPTISYIDNHFNISKLLME